MGGWTTGTTSVSVLGIESGTALSLNTASALHEHPAIQHLFRPRLSSPFYVTVEGFEYQVLYAPKKT